MPDLTPRLPKYRHYRPKRLAVVRLGGHDHYLGKYDSPESHEKYRRLVAEWLTSCRATTPTDPAQPAATPAVGEVLLAYWRHAEGHYRDPDGSPTRELANVRDAL